MLGIFSFHCEYNFLDGTDGAGHLMEMLIVLNWGVLSSINQTRGKIWLSLYIQ